MNEPFAALGLALAIGLLIGLERGWRQREQAEGSRLAGLRTFGLIGLMGGLVAILAREHGGWLLAVGLLALTAIVLYGYGQTARHRGDYGVTTEVAALVTFLLSALAASGYPAPAAAGAVVATGLLGLKDYLHGLLHRLDEMEMLGGLQLGLITLVVLPVLPNRGFGPWRVLNPHDLWLMVILISAIGFVGHFAVRLVGARRGLLMTGLFAGLASSTALTLALSRAGRGNAVLPGSLAAAVIIASTTMFPRVLVEVAVVNAGLLPRLWWPMSLLTAVGVAGALALWIYERGAEREGEAPVFARPFELGTAVKFAAVLAVIMLLAEAARRQLGDSGVYAVAVLSGLTDVDAITLSLSNMARSELSGAVAARGIVLASVTNTAVKAGLVAGLAGAAMAWRVAAVLGPVVALGVVMASLPAAGAGM
ncbi:MgtC/SapB family protein [Arhodomonas sp. AD133]|uniref:MgtC/SapB family protein n=1 Tax=Arhodomonas sp. AD133 TaxID=3415009 RepID=UPI003EB911D1